MSSENSKQNETSPWKLGVFYYNKEDNRLFPPKRTKLGWTVNFANPYSIIAMSIILLVLFLLIYLSNK